jgi:amidase/aspartyl-tRNA(Asn)/glutamyl-tRNA(Gln) amidotransferase subunit A
MGGSVRIPASFCGIAGLKPSLGRIPMDILPTVFDSISHFGPLARTLGDAALFLAVAQGPDERDIQSLVPALEVPVPPPAEVAGLKLALSLDLGYYAIDPEVAANTRAAAAALAAEGATVEEVELGWSRQVNDDWFAYWGVLLAACFGDLLETRRDDLDPNVVRLMEAGRAMDAVSFKRLEFARSEQWKKLAAVLVDFDALLCPTMALPPPPLGGTDADYETEDSAGRYRGLDMTCPFNFTGQCPALSVPSGVTEAGLPTGLQIVGRRFDDLSVLRIGAALERVRPWSARRPAI